MPQLTPQENFRLGFLMRCAEEGCDAEEIAGRVKVAKALTKFASIKDTLSSAWGVGKAIATLPIHVTALGLGASALAGGGVGYGLAKAQNTDVDPEEAKRQELISAYQLQAELARRRAQQRSYRRGAPAEPKLF